MVLSKETKAYREDAAQDGRFLSPEQREDLLKPYLPAPKKSTSTKTGKTRPVRTFFRTQLHILVFNIIHTIYSIYVRLRQVYHAILSRILTILYHHHRTPELIQKDVKSLSRLPDHLSVILELQEEWKGGAGLELLLDDVAEISAWCACAGIPLLSIYEKTGILKSYIPTTHRTVAETFHSYFGRGRPSLQVRAPHMPSFLNGDISEQSASPGDSGNSSHSFRPRRDLLNGSR